MLYTTFGAKKQIFMNKLHLETSPYLLQHANNPIHWNAWNSETLDHAKQKNKLIVVSVGYSACHWCHVMEHESFEDSDVANIMNFNFVSIKVDREERPDIDAVYMKAVQIMTNQGGWPMNVVCLPDGRPIWGGTYFRKNEWINSLKQLQELYLQNPEKIIDYAEKLQSGMQSIAVIQNKNPETELSQELLIPLVEKWKKSFDLEFGGMARAPKFMMPNNYAFLMRFALQYKDEKLLEFVNLTLTKMALGGLFDTIDGGFSRYSVDLKWHVPHFEKMLYDNGQLISLYADAYKLTQNPLYKEVIEKTLRFVERDWLTTEGGFFSALDADSLNIKNHLEEGAFYVWTKPELQSILNQDFELFSEVFNVNQFGFWEHNNYVLIQNQSLVQIAKNNKISVEKLQIKKQTWEKLLYSEREKRSKPRLDDKIITSWNALMLKGFIDAFKSIGNENYLKIALKNAHFISDNLISENGNLFHTYKNKEAKINGFLEDYSLVIESFIALYEVTFEENWLTKSKQLTDYCLDHFYDSENSFFSFKSNLDEQLIASHFETEDNVISASNSVMASNLYKLSIYYENQYFEKTCLKMLHHILPNVDYPSAYSNWLNVFMNFSTSNKELAICGKNALEFSKKINQKYIPNLMVSGTEKKSKLPFLQNRFQETQTLFYFCENKSCQQPSVDFNEILKKLES
jgi:uncharacterized protein